MVDVGLSDKFETITLNTGAFVEACHKASVPVIFKEREGYDHSFYYVASFIEEHIDFHAR
jgi:S-formylglutathione hydrolase